VSVTVYNIITFMQLRGRSRYGSEKYGCGAVTGANVTGRGGLGR